LISAIKPEPTNQPTVEWFDTVGWMMGGTFGLKHFAPTSPKGFFLGGGVVWPDVEQL